MFNIKSAISLVLYTFVSFVCIILIPFAIFGSFVFIDNENLSNIKSAEIKRITEVVIDVADNMEDLHLEKVICFLGEDSTCYE